METIYLKPLAHNQEENIALYFPNTAVLNKAVRGIKEARWSNTHKCWYVPLDKKKYNEIVRAFKGNANIDRTALHEYLINRKKKETLKTISIKETTGLPVTAPTKTVVTKTNIKKEIVVYKNGHIHSINAQVLPLMREALLLKSYSPSTIKTYLNEMSQLLQLLKNIPADELQPSHLKRYLVYCFEKLCLKENTLHSRMNAMKFYYEQVLDREKFFWKIPRPKKPIKLPKVISEEKIIKGLGSVENLKHKTLLLLAYSAGLRVSEVVSLKITDINSDRMQITINDAKGKKDRVVTLSKVILALLREYYKMYKPTMWLFEGQTNGDHYSMRSAQAIFKEAYQKLRLPPQCSFHSLRHSYATHLLESGTDIAYIQKLLGHNDIKTTLRYTQVSLRDTKKIESPLDKIMREKNNY